MIWGWTVFYLTVLFTWIAGRPSWSLLVPSRPRWLLGASAEIHPFMPYLYLTNLAISTWGEQVGSRLVSFAVTGLAFAGWFMDKDDDDRWKRRRRRIGDRVRSLGHRLVVSQGAP